MQLRLVFYTAFYDFARGNSRLFRSSGREYRGLDYWFKNYYKTLPTVILRSRIEETGI